MLHRCGVKFAANLLDEEIPLPFLLDTVSLQNLFHLGTTDRGPQHAFRQGSCFSGR